MNEHAMIDLIFNGQAQGAVAEELLRGEGHIDAKMFQPYYDPKTGRSWVTVFRGGDPGKLENYKRIPSRYAATLRRDEWKELDAAVITEAQSRLNGVQDLIDKGLTYTLRNGMGTTVLEWHDRSTALQAKVTMDGLNRGENDRIVFQTNYLPIPLIHADYEINARELAASRKLGNALDTDMAREASRAVSLQLEQMLFTNTTYSWGTKDDRNKNTIYSYVNHPDRIQVTMSASWDDSSTSPMVILNDLRSALQQLRNQHFRGPFQLYLPLAYTEKLDADYENAASNFTNMTLRDRIMKLGGIADIKIIDELATDNVLLVQMTSDVVRLVQGMGFTNMQWQEEGQFLTKYKVVTIQVPQIRSTQSGKTGIAHLSV